MVFLLHMVLYIVKKADPWTEGSLKVIKEIAGPGCRESIIVNRYNVVLLNLGYLSIITSYSKGPLLGWVHAVCLH